MTTHLHAHFAPTVEPPTADDVAVCPVHLRFAPCRRCTTDDLVLTSDPATVTEARAYQSGRGLSCTSRECVNVPAIVTGVINVGETNGMPPTKVSYCYRCAVRHEVSDFFAPREAFWHVEADLLEQAWAEDIRRTVRSTESFRLITSRP